jgi:hypothetical protein
VDYHLEKKILLNNESEYNSLYSWSLQEFNNENEKIGSDQIPWQWSLYFTASEFRYIYSIDINKSDESAIDDSEESNRESEVITAILHSGVCRDGESLENEVLYSMFGTNRLLNHLDLKIYKVKEDDNERCHIWGGVSYTSEIDFRDETVDDYVIIKLGLSPQRFDKIAELIKNQRVDVLEITLSMVSGFYAEWSPSISTSMIKILTNSILGDSQDQEVITLDDCEIDPPRLGDIGEFSMRIIQRNKLNPKQDLRSINIDELFEEPDDEENLLEEQKYKENSSMLSQLVRNEAALTKLHIPVWFIFIILCIFILK